MEMEFVKAIAKFAVAVAIIAAALLVTFGTLILLSPEMFFTVLTYAFGGICLISGIAILGSLIVGLVE